MTLLIDSRQRWQSLTALCASAGPGTSLGAQLVMAHEMLMAAAVSWQSRAIVQVRSYWLDGCS